MRISQIFSGFSDLEKVNLSNSKKPSNPPSLASLVAAKISVGDVKGAVHLASSDDSVLNPSQEIKSKLELKHPKPAEDSQIPPFNPLPGVICDRKSVL